MKVALIAGGIGSRLSEETRDKPKALVTVGGRPILWHVMMSFHQHGFSDFVVALGYRGDSIRASFANGALAARDPLANGDLACAKDPRGWSAQLVDTGDETENGGRLKRLAEFLGNETFAMAWCDGLIDLDFRALVAFHRAHGRLATLVATHPPARFGRLDLDGDRVREFSEKTVGENEWINAGYFVLEPGVLDYIEGDETEWNYDCLTRLARDGQLMAYRHRSFWQCMDTVADRNILESLWADASAPWKSWR